MTKETKHTPGPLKVDGSGMAIYSANDKLQFQPMMAYTSAPDLSLHDCKANARRIVACWNACEGMDDAEVSRGIISTSHYSTVVDERDEAKAINAELLEAAQEMAELLENILRIGAINQNLIVSESIRNVLPIHRAAIAKAEGKS